MTSDQGHADCLSELNDLKAKIEAVAEEYERVPRLIASGAVAGMLREWIDNGGAGHTKILALIRDLVDEDPCWFDHHGGCQAHGYLSLEPGEKCPHQEAKELLGRWSAN